MNQNPILVERYRAGVLESFHRGVICVVDKNNKILFSVGDVQQICYPRSALKLIQVLPLLESGAAAHYGFTDKEIAIMCGSHNGEKQHLEVVNGILAKIGLDKEYLKCGKQYPTLNEDRNDLICAHKNPEHIHNNCSGKHAGFLALAKFLGEDLETYLLPQHPIHQLIKKVTAEIHEYPIEKIVTAMDGCSAPIFSLPVFNQAVAYKNLCDYEQYPSPRREAIKRVVDCVTAYPEMIGGTKRYCSEMMALCGKKVFGKTGADGIYSIGFINEKLGCCIKIDDGLMGPQYAVAQKLLEESGLFAEAELAALHHYVEEPLTNWNKWETGICKVNEEAFVGFKEKISNTLLQKS
ncbi:MAG: asparaginase [Bacteroidetes bacterium]|nr:asparaginase [Bacteroidota bacterium]